VQAVSLTGRKKNIYTLLCYALVTQNLFTLFPRPQERRVSSVNKDIDKTSDWAMRNRQYNGGNLVDSLSMNCHAYEKFVGVEWSERKSKIG